MQGIDVISDHIRVRNVRDSNSTLHQNCNLSEI